MSNKSNELPVLALSLAITLLLLAGGGWLLKQQLSNGGLPGLRSARTSSSNRFSSGQQSLLSATPSADKQRGLEALAAGNYPQAVAALEASLAAQRNDPESRIYLNNARIGAAPAYTIAIAAPMATEPNPALEILRGVAQAQTAVNQAGGIAGTPLKVLLVSDDNDPEVAKTVAAKLVQDPSVLGVIGHYSSGATLAAAPIYEQGQLVMISPTSTAVKLSNAGQYIYRTVPSDRLAASTLAKYLLSNQGYQRVAVFFSSQSEYSQSIKSEFTTAMLADGGNVVAEFDLSAPTFEAEAAVQTARQQQAQALMLSGDINTLDPSLQVIAANRRQLPLAGNDDMYNPKLLQIGGENALEMVVVVPWHVRSHLQTAFVKTSRQLWGGDVSWRTAMAYDAAQALIAALTQNPTRSGVQQVLQSATVSIQGTTSEVKFFPSGDRNQPDQLVQVQRGQRSGFGYDFVPLSN